MSWITLPCSSGSYFKRRVWRLTGRTTKIAQWYSARLEIWRSEFWFRFKFFSWNLIISYQINLISKYKLIICAFRNYNFISRENLNIDHNTLGSIAFKRDLDLYLQLNQDSSNDKVPAKRSEVWIPIQVRIFLLK